MPHPTSSKFVQSMRQSGRKIPKARTEPLWQGPEDEGPLGGVTQSLLARYLVCKERFRLYSILGLKSVEVFEPRIEYGQMWHACEEALAAGTDWTKSLVQYARDCAAKYPMQKSQVDHWYQLCKVQFPVYIGYWKAHPDVKKRVPMWQEEVFHVPYLLPSGRQVWLRGKFDSVDLIQEKPEGVYIQENKTKSECNSVKLIRQMKFDLQTMLYVIALEGMKEQNRADLGEHGGWVLGDPKWFLDKHPIRGVRYNVIKRSAHKIIKNFEEKMKEDAEANRMGEWFCRLRVEVSRADIDKFKNEFLNPCLEELCDWYNLVTVSDELVRYPFGSTWESNGPLGIVRHYRYPFGIYSTLNEGGFGDVDEFMDTGCRVGLRKVDTLFEELNK